MKKIMIAAVCAVMCISCTKEQSGIQSSRQFTLSAGVESSTDEAVPEAAEEEDTKTYISSNYKGVNGNLSWSGGDALAIYTESDRLTGSLTISSGTTTATGTFVGDVTGEGTPKYAVYPASLAGVMTGSGITVTVPSSQKVSNINSVGKNCNVSIGEIETDGETSTVEMKNICGLVKIYAPSSKVTSVKLEANENMSGTVIVNYNGGVPSFTVTEGEKYVELKSMFLGAMFMMSVLPGTYTGLKITVTFADKSTKTFTSASKLVVERNKVTSLGVLPVAEYTYVIDFEDQTFDKLSTAGTELTKKFALTPKASGDSVSLNYGVLAGSSGSYVTYSSSVKGFQMQGYNSYLHIPAQSGKKLCLIKANNGNSSGTAKKSYGLYTALPAKAISSLNNAWTVNGYARTPSFSLCSTIWDKEDTATGDFYLFGGTKSSNVSIHSMTLYYTE